MRLVHYASEPFGELEEFGEPPEKDWRTYFYKPHGLWVSDEDAEGGWREWCIDNRFNLECLTHVHDVVLAPDAKVLVISNPRRLDQFTADFRLPSYYDKKLADDMRSFVASYGLGWREVAKIYDGLIITPYLWERRLDPTCMWYYGWDCAGGCLWHTRAIQSVTLREVVPIPETTPIEGESNG